MYKSRTPVMQSTHLIQSRRNGKYYPVNEETGEVELEYGKQMSAIELYPYDVIEKTNGYWVYQIRPGSTFLQKLKKVKEQILNP
jgi:hypothetical protein